MVVFGAILCLIALTNSIARVVGAMGSDRIWIKSFQKLLTPGTVKLERDMKLACSFKVNQMIRNACEVHASAQFQHGDTPGSKDSSYGHALLSFNERAEALEEYGEPFWVWKRLFNRKLFREDGIWLNNRMLQGNVGQLVLCLYLIPFLQVVLDLLENVYVSILSMTPARWRILVPMRSPLPNSTRSNWQ